jgi:multiple sugar transport system permease protein
VVFVVSAVFLEFIFGMICALILAQKSDTVRRVVGSLLILPYMIAGSVAGLIWRLLWTYEYGLVNYVLNLLGFQSQRWLGDPAMAMVSVIITEVWRNTPFVTLVLLAGLMSIPREIYESARVDGANVLQRFKRLTLPLLSPAITIALLFRTIFAIRVFDVIYTMTRGGPGTATMPIGILLYNQNFRFFQVGNAAALALVILAVGMVISFFYLRVVYRRVDF